MRPDPCHKVKTVGEVRSAEQFSASKTLTPASGQRRRRVDMPKQPDENQRKDPLEPWKEIVLQINAEKDPARRIELYRKLDEIMLGKEREKLKRKFPNVA